MAKKELIRIVRRDKNGDSYYTDGQIWLEKFDEGLSNNKDLLKSVLESVDCIGEFVFSKLDTEEFTIPDNIKKLDYYVFRNNIKLKKVAIGKVIKLINQECFSHCSKLSTVILPEGLERICRGAFYSCPSLTEITFPKTLKGIGDFAFSETGLKCVTLPEGCEVSPTSFPTDTKINFIKVSEYGKQNSEDNNAEKRKIIQGMIQDYSYRQKIDANTGASIETLMQYEKRLEFLQSLLTEQDDTTEVGN